MTFYIFYILTIILT